MKDKLINDLFEISYESSYEFKKHYGFTFVFRTKSVFFRKKISSSEIKPVGIIYDENGEYYFAPLDKVENIEGIVEEYVKNCMQ